MTRLLAVVLLALASAAALATLTAVPPWADPADQTTRGGGSPPLSERLDAYVGMLAREGRFSGSVLVARRGKVLLAKGYGAATLTPARRNTPSTSFRIGSITKTFTAVAVLELAQQRRLLLDAPICSRIRACPRSWRPITIRMLLAHTAGLSQRLDSADWAQLKDVPLARVVARLKTLPLEFRPGTRWSYCNACYLVAGYIVERVSKSGLSYLRRRIFRAAGMTATTYDSGRAGASGALAYEPDRLGVLRRAPDIAMANPDTAGGLRSTVLDLYRFSRALETNRLLSRRFRQLMFAGTKVSRRRRSLGWELANRHGHRIERHTGSVGGWSAVLSRFPGAGLTLVVLANSGADAVAQLNHNLPSIVFGWPVVPPELPALANVEPALLDRYLGHYRATSSGRLDLQINRSADRATLVLYPGPYGGGDRLGPLSTRRFVDLRAPHWSIEFRVRNRRASALVMRSTQPRMSFVARRVP